MLAIKNDPLQDIPQAATNAYLHPISPSFARFGSALISSVIMVSALSALNTGFLTPPRVLFAMARDEMFIPSFAKVHHKTKSPYVAIIGQGITSISVFLVVTFLVLYTGVGSDGNQANRNLNTAADIFDQLTNIAVLSSTVFIVMTIGAVFILRKKEPDTHRPYQIPGYPLVPAIALLMNSVFLVLVLMKEAYAGVFSAVFLLCSVPLYFAFNKDTAEGT